MRTHHTYTQQCSTPVGTHTPVERIQLSGLAPAGLTKNHPASSKPVYSKAYDQASPLAKMRNNLEQGMAFVRAQKTALLHLDENLGHLARINNHATTSKPNLARDLAHHVPLQAMEEIAKKKHLGFPLFGDGSEQPIRIHLRQRGREFSHEIPLIPLFSDPVLLAILHCAHSPQCPPSSILTEGIKSVLQFSLEVENQNQSLIHLYQAFSPTPSNPKVVSKGKTQHTTAVGKIRKYIISWFCGHLSKQSPLQTTRPCTLTGQAYSYTLQTPLNNS
jgi:hypothetical protein